ncbi:MAG: VOC family protein [Methanobacterium sp.]|jgi:predicted enzyme related to lactoylglutathione lyase
MPRIVHFEIPADDPERAVKFYEKVFGWEIEKWEGGEYWLITTGPDEEPGINGAIMPKEEGNDMVRNSIEVDSFDEFKEKIESEGGKMLMEKTQIPGIGDWALFQDTEGNISGMLEPTEEWKAQAREMQKK